MDELNQKIQVLQQEAGKFQISVLQSKNEVNARFESYNSRLDSLASKVVLGAVQEKVEVLNALVKTIGGSLLKQADKMKTLDERMAALELVKVVQSEAVIQPIDSPKPFWGFWK